MTPYARKVCISHDLAGYRSEYPSQWACTSMNPGNIYPMEHRQKTRANRKSVRLRTSFGVDHSRTSRRDVIQRRANIFDDASPDGQSPIPNQIGFMVARLHGQESCISDDHQIEVQCNMGSLFCLFLEPGNVRQVFDINSLIFH